MSCGFFSDSLCSLISLFSEWNETGVSTFLPIDISYNNLHILLKFPTYLTYIVGNMSFSKNVVLCPTVNSLVSKKMQLTEVITFSTFLLCSKVLRFLSRYSFKICYNNTKHQKQAVRLIRSNWSYFTQWESQNNVKLWYCYYRMTFSQTRARNAVKWFSYLARPNKYRD